MATITIDGTDYDGDKLSNDTRAQLTNLSFVDNELRRLQAKAATLETARQVYVAHLKKALESETALPKADSANS
jgi:hypothetical protein